MSADDRKPEPPPRPEPPKRDPQEEAERRLRQMLALESRKQRDQMGTIQKGFYGCVGVLVVLFLILLFFF